ncbi:MAG: hypothetical protein PVG60_01410 [Desulfarculaceae bacterium]
MTDLIVNMPLWLIKTLAGVLGLGLVLLVGLLVSRFYRRLTDRLPLE